MGGVPFRRAKRHRYTGEVTQLPPGRHSPTFKAALLDWVGTLIVPKWGPDQAGPKGGAWIEWALRRLGRDASLSEASRISGALNAAIGQPDVAQAMRGADASVESYRAGFARWVSAAGIDEALRDALYDELAQPDVDLFAVDVERTLATLKAAGVRVAVVSDVHFDIRPWFVKAGLDGYVDRFVLSFEHGVCKPDPAIFRLALDGLKVGPGEALMVGDRSAYDGAAVEAGIATLLLPPLAQATVERLHLVLASCGLRDHVRP
ncbi:HAD-IA family hydrolase [Streptomyces sp. SID8377]|nr:HAD-IA family hydrolase [Streptomyces sp. SID8377]MYX38171.1 HAD-IA family hydrolase [Streptomyces sp. SID8377]